MQRTDKRKHVPKDIKQLENTSNSCSILTFQGSRDAARSTVIGPTVLVSVSSSRAQLRELKENGHRCCALQCLLCLEQNLVVLVLKFSSEPKMPSASFTASRSYVRRSRRKGANRIPTPSRTTSGKWSDYGCEFCSIWTRRQLDLSQALPLPKPNKKLFSSIFRSITPILHNLDHLRLTLVNLSNG